jgi:biotin carboxylase
MMKKDKRRFMVLGAGPSNSMSLREFSSLPGTELIVLDGNPRSIGRKLAHRFECADITNPCDVLSRARKYRIHGIYAMNDHGMRAAAFTAETMGLRGMSLATAHAAVDKGYMREIWKTAGIPQPHFRVVTRPEEMRDFGREAGYPLVVKPVDCGGGGRGVFIISREKQVEAGFVFASRFLNRNNRLIVEKYVEGTETSVEAFRWKGKTHIIAWSDKVKPPYLSRVATSINYPGLFSRRVMEKIKGISDMALRAIGLKEGFAHLEFIVETRPSGKIWILEMGARAGGGHTLHPIASHVSGSNYPALIADFCCRRPFHLKLKKYRGACYRFLNPSVPGRLLGVKGLEAAGKIPGVVDIGLWKKAGDQVGILENSLERTGFIVTLAGSRGEALAGAVRAEKLIRFDIDPSREASGKADFLRRRR